MRSGKNAAPRADTPRPANTNGEDLRRALNWIVSDRMFSDLRLHGNTAWTGAALVRLAVLWVWSPESSLVAAANDAIEGATKIFGSSAVASYQALTNALRRYSDQLFPVLYARLHGLMRECDHGRFRIGRWLVLAVDGSRIKAPRTVKNERGLCKSRVKSKKRSASKSKKRRQKGPMGQRTRHHPRDEGPLVWLTMIWHVGERVPWCWKTGPAYSSERHHLLDMLEEQPFAENTLFCADGGYIGYELWRAMDNREHRFLIRVGANVHLLKSLGHSRQRDDIVYSWPERMMAKHRLPLKLRLFQFKDSRNRDVHLVTNVLQEKLLTRRQAGEIYRQRWGIEVQFRSLKQTFGRTKLRSRTPDRAMMELQWSLVGMTMIQLLARKERLATGNSERCTSMAMALRIVRQVMQHHAATPHRSQRLKTRLAQAVIDAYQRTRPKGSRDYPRQKDPESTGNPRIRAASKVQLRRLHKLTNA